MPQMFQQRQPQQFGRGPQLGQREGRDALIGADELVQVVLLEAAVEPADKLHGQRVDPRQSVVGPAGKDGQVFQTARDK